jgi:hypothetical protein
VSVTDARAEIEDAKVNAIAAVGMRAMQDVALLSQVEQSLAQTVPQASGRLATIADLAALSMADGVGHRLDCAGLHIRHARRARATTCRAGGQAR